MFNVYLWLGWIPGYLWTIFLIQKKLKMVKWSIVSNAKVKNSILDPEIPEFVGDIGIIQNDFQSLFYSTI